MEYKIGKKSLLSQVPKLIDISGRPWILNTNEDGIPIIFDAICPHQAGIVNNLKQTEWTCPNHLWKFDPKSGNSITTPTKGLKSFPVTIKNDNLYVNLDIISKPKSKIKPEPKIPPKITLVSAAGLLFEWKGFNILSDPWMIGPCMLGSWTNYPPELSIDKLPKLDAIWISHEHSDHYHEPTLSRLDKNTPVYITKFDDGHLANSLKKLGFKNVIEIKTGEPIFLNSEIQLTSFKSASVWNDSISYWKFDNFSILNVNDAGFNWKIKDIVGQVDVICQQFTGPTSSYPFAWTHLDDSKKQNIQIGMNNGMLRMMKTVAEICNAKYVLPFANFFELANPEHLEYDKFITKNSLEQVLKFFQNSEIEVLDLIPRESWDGKFTRIKNRENFFENDFIEKSLHSKYENETKLNLKPTIFDMDHEEIKNYFEAFGGSQLTKNIGHYRILFTIEDSNDSFNALITFDNGNVKYESNITKPQNVEMTMSCPGAIIQEIIRKDLSWDEAYNGFWCTFSRDPDVYNIHLWKLLYAPWRARSDYVETTDLDYNLKPLTLSIADIIEKGGSDASQIFEKFGLNCTGCAPGMGETVEDGCKMHGLSKQKTKNLLNELASINYKN